MPARIFIYEPYATGHHTVFLRILLAALTRDRAWSVSVLTTERARRHTAFQRLVSEFESGLEVVTASARENSALVGRVVGPYYSEQFANWRSLRSEFVKLHRERGYAFALVPYMEALGVHNLAFRDCFGTVPFAVIPHGLRFHFTESGIRAPRRAVDVLQRVCFRRLLNHPGLKGIFTLDRYLAAWAKHEKVIYVPDPRPLPPAMDRNDCRRQLQLPEEGFIVLAYGAIDERKCLDILLPAISGLTDMDLVLVIAGVQDARIRNGLLSSDVAAGLRHRSRLVELNRFVSSDEERLLFGAADVVWSYNRDSMGSSGVFITAGQFSKPALVSPNGMAGKIASDERCGVVVPSEDPQTVMRAIADLASRPALRRELGQRAYAHFSKYTPDAFAKPITDVIRDSCEIEGPQQKMAVR